jgi:DNA-binding transcriptional ArsR family regulator
VRLAVAEAEWDMVAERESMEEELKAIADIHRQRILRLVWGQELSAGKIAEVFEITRPAISQHIRVLKKANLIQERREGTRRYYKTNHARLAQIQSFIASFWQAESAA